MQDLLSILFLRLPHDFLGLEVCTPRDSKRELLRNGSEECQQWRKGREG